MSTEDPTSPAAEELSYTSAVAELEGILVTLEDDDVDIDALTSQVKRAAELIGVCRQRITTAKVEVEKVVADLNGPAPATNPEASEEPNGLDL